MARVETCSTAAQDRSLRNPSGAAGTCAPAVAVDTTRSLSRTWDVHFKIFNQRESGDFLRLRIYLPLFLPLFARYFLNLLIIVSAKIKIH